ncbi:hypothetical protein [Aeromicrobium sp.]|uniref:hypothetical protein n=1 Tax=Aeromicrobium sp. TaxID=1871063 RepID=UPI00199D19CC|nr:hypothetical protein [Aeromicrobium sp.]MBC7632211.1 hypothetical protein [Aeromicrobium sp.]
MTTTTFTKKKKFAILTAALVLVGGGAAYAYWTTTGTGVGTAATGTNATVSAIQTSTVTAMAPGVAPQTLSGNFNNANAGPAYVTNVVASIGTVTKDAGAPTGACTAADYTLTNATMTVGSQVPAGSAQGAWTGATIAFSNSGANQDGCKNATVALVYAVN